MALKFGTPHQGMKLLDFSNNQCNQWSLNWDPMNEINNLYGLQFSIQKTEDSDTVANINLVHSAFGIGLPGDELNITPYLMNISPLPPINNDLQCTVNFFNKKGNHCCINAQFVDNDNPPNLIEPGTTLNQIMAVTDFKVVNGDGTYVTGSDLSFIITNNQYNSSDKLKLVITEYDINGIPITPGSDDSWKPTIEIPTYPNLIASDTSIIGVITSYEIDGIGAGIFYSIKLHVCPKNDLTTHLFSIQATVPVTKHYIGSIDLKVESVESTTAQPHPAPDAHVFGGCQSPDIVLYDLSNKRPMPLGGGPTGPWDTVLKPNTEYGFAAVVHNNSTTEAVNTVVRFWDFPHGLSSEGELLDVQTVTVPANDSVEVSSAHNFKSAGDGDHKCAIISIYNSQVSTSSPDAITAGDVVDPNINISHSCSAWRNTDSQLVGSPFHFRLALNHKEPVYGPVKIKLQTFYVPADWYNDPEVLKTDAILKLAGVQRRIPLYMIPNLRKTMKPIALKLGIKIIKGGKVTADRIRNGFIIQPVKEKPTYFNVFGDVPSNTKNGDVILVNVIAKYPKTKKTPAKSIEFLQLLHVKR